MLQDHFHPPLSARRHWHAFHNAWATYIASHLNHVLPEGYFAEPNVQFGIEIDVAAFEEPLPFQRYDGYGNVSVLPAKSVLWQPPPPHASVPFQPMSEAVEVGIFNDEAGPVLMAAIELVSPANKDRPAQRQAFVAKCATYLRQGLGLIVVDVVTGRQANLHHELLAYVAAENLPTVKSNLYASAYRVVEHDQQPRLDIWQEALNIGQALPTLPLWLKGNLCLPVELGETYALTCREQRINVQTA